MRWLQIPQIASIVCAQFHKSVAMSLCNSDKKMPYPKLNCLGFSWSTGCLDSRLRKTTITWIRYALHIYTCMTIGFDAWTPRFDRPSKHKILKICYSAEVVSIASLTISFKYTSIVMEFHYQSFKFFRLQPPEWMVAYCNDLRKIKVP